MTQQISLREDDDLLNLLKGDNKGWNIWLFEDQIKITTCLCGYCNSVCCDAVELGCNHDDDDIYTFCKNCLSDLIDDVGGMCPINKHNDPIIIPSRSIRRQISKSIVICPYSIKYKQQRCNQNVVNKSQIIDTIGDESKEGIMLNKNNIGIKGCEWRGTLNELLNTDHLKQCTIEYNPLLAQNVTINTLQQKVKDQENKIQQQIKLLTELKLKLDIANDKNMKIQQQLNEQSVLIHVKDQEINLLKQAISIQSKTIDDNDDGKNNDENYIQRDSQNTNNDLPIESQAKHDIYIYGWFLPQTSDTAQWWINEEQLFNQIGKIKVKHIEKFYTEVNQLITGHLKPSRTVLNTQKINLADKKLQIYLKELQVMQQRLVKIIDTLRTDDSIVSLAIKMNECIVSTILWFNALVRKAKTGTAAGAYKDTLVNKNVMENIDLTELEQQLLFDEYSLSEKKQQMTTK